MDVSKDQSLVNKTAVEDSAAKEEKEASIQLDQVNTVCLSPD